LQASILELTPPDRTPFRTVGWPLPIGRRVHLRLAQAIRAVTVVAVETYIIQAHELAASRRDIGEARRRASIRLDHVVDTLVEQLSSWTFTRIVFTLPLRVPTRRVVIRVGEVDFWFQARLVLETPDTVVCIVCGVPMRI